MSFAITPLQFWEIDTYTYLRKTVFAAADPILDKCMFPQGYTRSVHAFLRRGPEKDLEDPNDHFLLIRDAATKEIVGAAEWEVQLDTRSIKSMLAEEAEAIEKRRAMAPIEGVNPIALDKFRVAQAQCHRELMRGRPHMYLGILVVDSKHQRRGVGQAVMKWGLDMADELGLPAYLESSGMGKGLYEKWGFVVERIMPFDAREIGHENQATHYCMVRPARGKAVQTR